jgi:acyl-CoA synthetase (AMP-forming)/AMP-acid ligase II
MQPIVRISASQAASLTLSELIEYHHLHNPEQTYAVFPGPTDNPDSGPERITFLEFARASHRFVRAVCKSLHVAIPLYSGEVVGVIANVDTVLYITAVAGLVCAGFTVRFRSSSRAVVWLTSVTTTSQVFPISPRNSPAAIAHLLRTTGSHKLLVSRESLSSLVEDVQAVLIGEEYDILIQELPFLDEVYPLLAHERAEDPFEPVDLSGVRTLADSPLIIIHSSGSTVCSSPPMKGTS